jgi:type VI secretion system protein ImpF
MLLFERLIDFSPLEQEEAARLAPETEADEAASVRREIGRLIHTRRPLGVVRALDALPTSVRDSGVPDCTTLSPRCDEDRAAFAQAICHAIRQYEPRLEEPRVEVVRSAESASALHLIVSGHLRGARDRQRMTFPIDLAEV